MTLINKTEIKIFLIFWIIYIFHAHWVGWAEFASYDLTMSISNEKRFEIDSYYNNTGDRSFYKEHYYSNKNPGASFINILPYSTLKFWYSVLPISKYTENTIVWQEDVRTVTEYGESVMYFVVNPRIFNQLAQWFSIIFTTAFISAFSVVIIYKISGKLKLGENKRKLICVAFGLGTMIFAFATNFFQHAFGMFAGLLTFYLLFTRGNKLLYQFLAGTVLGYAIVSDGNFFYLVFSFIIYHLIKFMSFRKISLFSIGIVIGILPLLFYNYSIFSSIWQNIYYYSDPTVRSDIQKEFGFNLPNLFLVYRHTFDTYRGLFIFNPILILSFLGFPLLFKEFKKEAYLVIIFYLFQLLFYSSFNTDFTLGASFGPRQYLPSIPFLTLPLIMFLRKEKSMILFLPLLILSVFINSVLSNFDWETLLIDNSKPTLLVKRGYQEKATNSFETLRNPLTEWYTPHFFKYGLKSRVIDGIITKNINLKLQHTGFSIHSLPFFGLLIFL